MAAAVVFSPFFLRRALFQHRISIIPNPLVVPRKPSLIFSRRSSSLRSAAVAASSAPTANVIDILRERGLVESLTSDDIRHVSSLRVYCGFDPTAESLHLGNLIALVVLSWFRRCGHRTVAVIGGATGLVGDPSGKSLERPELDPLTVSKNADHISDLVSQILNRRSETLTLEILNNYTWWKDINLLSFLRDVGRFARVGTMMAKESVKKRLTSEEGLSFTEFTYQLLQAYDFLHLFKNLSVNVQIGGADQWGNITAGTELIRRVLRRDTAYGLTFPLLLKSDGTKFGKTETGAVWLSPAMLSPYKFYQYFFSVPDTDVVRLLKTLTFVAMEEIKELEIQMWKPDYVPNTAQRRLAEEVTRFVHGDDGLSEAVKVTEALRPGTETELDAEAINGVVEEGVPSLEMEYGKVVNSGLLELTLAAGLVGSKSAARRLVKQGGLYLNNRRVEDEEMVVESKDLVEGKVLLLSAGKKNKVVVRVC